MSLVIQSDASQERSTEEMIMSVVRLNNANVKPFAIYPNLAQKYRGDFDGLLDEIGILEEDFNLTLLLNGLKSSGDFDGTKYTIMVVDYPE